MTALERVPNSMRDLEEYPKSMRAMNWAPKSLRALKGVTNQSVRGSP